MRYIPKQQHGGSIPQLQERNGIYYINEQVVGEKPVSGTDPVGEFIVAGEVAGPLFKLAGKGLGYVGNKIISRLKPAKTITDRFFKFIGKETPKTSIQPIEFKGLRDQQQKLLLEELQKNGVDISKVSFEDLNRALERRMYNIQKTAPESYTYVTPSNTWGNANITMSDIRKGQEVGRMELLPGHGADKYIHIGDTKNLGKGAHGVSEKMLNSSTNVAKSLGKEGTLTGEELASPHITVNHVWPKFTDKKLIGNYGTHYWSNHTSLPNQTNAPVYLIQKPTEYIPTKSIIFNPNIIDKFGKMKINWNDADIFKTISPIGIGTTVVDKNN